MRRMTVAPPSRNLPSPGGLVLAPLRAVRYDPAVAGDLAALLSPPYDVVDTAGVERLERASPHNVVRLILPRDPETGAAGAYERAATTLRSWLADGTLRPDSQPALYVYEIAGSGHVQRGLVGSLGLVPPEAGVVLPHENTMAGPVADRLALTAATQANLEPIFLVYDGGGAASAAVNGVSDSTPLAQALTDDGLTHRLWALTDPDQLAGVAADLLPRRAVIADGHHRYATYLSHQADRHAAGDGPGAWDFGLALLVDATAFGPQVHAIHRVVPELPAAKAAMQAGAGFNVRQLAWRSDADLDTALAALASAGGEGPAFLIAGPGELHLLTDPDAAAIARVMPTGRSEASRSLDVSVAHLLLISELWGLHDSEQTVDYCHDVHSALEAAAATGGTALLLNPTPVAAVVAVAAAGERMPRKSTLFTPKPRTGLLLRTFTDS